MFIAMNRFKVIKGCGADFEHVWLSRDTHLDKVPGFVEFHLLRGPELEDHTLYASHTVWQSRAAFETWTRSEASARRTRRPAATSRFISGPRSSKGLRRFRQSVAASRRSRSPLSRYKRQQRTVRRSRW